MKTAAVVREGLGFDRAMVYRFDADWHGQVIGESLIDDTALESYLNLRFPASDVPKSARRLYEEVSIRSSVDLAAEPSRLLVLAGPKSETPTDLAQLRIRATAPSCRTYYANMGIRASIVLPIKVSGKVWGHISFHNRNPTRLPIDLEKTLIACGTVFSNNVMRLDLSRRLVAERKTLKLQVELAAEPADHLHSRLSLQRKVDSLRQALKSDFACLKLDKEEITAGELLQPDDAKFLEALRKREFSGFFSTDRLVQDLPELETYAQGWGGLLAIQMGEGWREAFILLRRVRKETGVWAGNPHEGLKWLASGKPQMTPRNSFASYLATTKHSSHAWSEDDLYIANSCTLVLGLQLLRIKAEAATMAQSAFLANMSHEIRTPMTAIVGYSDLLAEGALELDEATDAIETIKRNGKHLLALINDILDVSKLRAGEMTIEVQRFSPLQGIKDVLSSLNREATAKGTALQDTSNFGPEFQIVSDSTRFRQILMNLVGNAIKFTANGQVTVTSHFDCNSRTLSVEVADTGIGMSASQLKAVRDFRPFHQADVSMTRRFGGTGLGLTISKALVTLLRGTLEVDSVEGQGSSFRFTLLDMLESPGRPEVSASTIENSTAVEPQNQNVILLGCRILLVEDGEDNRRLVSFHLKKAGAILVTAENGEEAVSEASASPQPFDVILMDMQMPVMDGYDATKMLRRAGYIAPILALTAHALEGEREKCMAAGCDGFLTKPIDKQSLLNSCADAWRYSSAKTRAVTTSVTSSH